MQQIIPDGFIDLIKIMLEQDKFSYANSPQSLDDVWKEMVWLLFLSRSRSDASINYIFGLLDENDFIEYSKLSKFNSDDWEDWEEKVVQLIKKGIEDVDSRRAGVLKNLLLEIKSGNEKKNPLFYVRSAMRYFNDKKITRDLVEERTRNEIDEKNFLAEMYYSGEGLENENKITGVGASKAILFLHAFGKALNRAPPTRHVKNFINYDIYKREYGRTEENDEIIMGEMEDYVKNQIKPIIPDVTVRDVERTVWLWKSSQSLLTDFGRGEKKKLTPTKFAEFIKKHSVRYVKDKLIDIDDQLDLAEELKHRL